MTRIARVGALAIAVGALAAPLRGQSTGSLAGHVVDANTERPVVGADIRLDGGRYRATTDTGGMYRIRGVAAGLHRLSVTLPGYRPEYRDSIEVRTDQFTRVDIRLAPLAVQLETLQSVGVQDPVLDPLATATEQRVTAQQLRRLPVTTLQDALAMQAGVVGESYRGGRPGEQEYVLDGLGVKNQLDASTNGAAAIRIPPDLIESASLITNGFSARYSQAISGVIDINTKDGGDHWHGRTAYETDRPLAGSADRGIDRVVAEADGPLGRLRAVGVMDLSGQLDGDPVDAPAPIQSLDPRSVTPYPLPHNSVETWTAGAKLTMPFTPQLVGRVFGLATNQQAYLYDPVYKYDPDWGGGSRTRGTLGTASLQLLPSGTGHSPVFGELRVGYFDKTFVRGTVEPPDYFFGAFTGRSMHILGEEVARRQDTVATRNALPGFGTPHFASNTPWGVPAFFMTGGGSGELAWNEFSEWRTQLDATWVVDPHFDLNFGGLYAAQGVKTFQRALAYDAVGARVPPPVASNFSPAISGAYLEGRGRTGDLGVMAGVRLDGFTPGAKLANTTLGARTSINPRVSVSTMVAGATIVASAGRFSQAPDLQYLVDAAFDDTTRTGRFRQGNPNLGFESSTQYELSTRVRLPSGNSLKVNVYDKNLTGLVASVPIDVDPDSSVFANADIGTVLGAEVIFERELHDGFGARISGVVQRATATVSNAFRVNDQTHVDPVTHDTIAGARAQFPLDFDRRLGVLVALTGEINPHGGIKLFGGYPVGGLQMSAVGRYATGLPYSRTNTAGDSVVGLINGSRLPTIATVDALFRKPISIGRLRAGIYLDVRNVLNTRTEISERRDTGTPMVTETRIDAMALDAYRAHPEAIPYESPRYRARADLNGDHSISGVDELMPLYREAARDFSWPILVYGPPRLVRFGVEVLF